MKMQLFKTKSTSSLVLQIIVIVAVAVLVVGIVVSLVNVFDKNKKDDGGTNKPSGMTSVDGTTAVSPSTCSHVYENGVCTKCGYVCLHKTETIAENGNTYCSVCGLLTALKAPVLSASDNTVSWTIIPDAASYEVYVNGVLVQDSTKTNYIFTAEKAGTFEVTVKAKKGLVKSSASNSKIFNVCSVLYSLTNIDKVIVAGGADRYVSFVEKGKAVTISISPKSGYMLPDDVSITVSGTKLIKGVGYTYTELMTDDGDEYANIVIAASSVTGDIVITGSGVEVQLCSVVSNVTNGSLRGSGESEASPTVAQGNIYTARIVSNVGYTLPETITVTMGGITLMAGTGYTYNSGTGAVSIPNVTGNIVITAVCIDNTLSAPTGLSISNGVLTWNAVTGATSYGIRVTSQNLDMIFDEYYTSNTASFDFSNCDFVSADTYTVAVWGLNTNSIGETASIIYTVYAVATPTIVDLGSVDGYTIRFKYDKNSNAASVKCYLNGSLCTAATVYTDISGYDMITIPDSVLQQGNNTVYIVLTGVDGYLDSLASNTLTYTYPLTYTVDDSGIVNGSLRGEGEADPEYTVIKGSTYTARIVNNIGYTLPESITITMGGATLTDGTGYTYNSSTGSISISNVTGNIVITATCLEEIQQLAAPVIVLTIPEHGSGENAGGPAEGK